MNIQKKNNKWPLLSYKTHANELYLHHLFVTQTQTAFTGHADGADQSKGNKNYFCIYQWPIR